jgi:hypothetical protein
MARAIETRLRRLERLRRDRDQTEHWIPILFYPWDLPYEVKDVWLAEQLACTCRPGCPGKGYSALLPAKAPTVEQWVQQAQDYYQRRARDADP